jgi:ABC-type uncharacterized transport system substrate-binding protein
MILRFFLTLLALLAATAADAHPHVWVTFHSEVVYTATGEMTAIRHIWTFDDMYSAFAIQGIAHAKKGEYTRQELTSLAQLNMKSLKSYDYFTYAKADGRKLQFAGPSDYWLDYRDSTLTLQFTLPLKALVAAKTMEIEVYDPTIFVDFEFAKGKPASLEGAPECRLKTEFPRQPTAREQQQLSELDTNPDALSGTYGEVFANKIFVTCP